jgi:hypothetical protein
MNYKRLIANITLTAVCLTGCVESYDIRYDLAANVLSVEGFVRDSDITSVVIRRSESYQSSVIDKPVKGCTVEILIDNSTKVSLKEKEPGVYFAPDDFRGVVGKKYQLLFKTPDGRSYQSLVEEMNAVAPVKKVYQKFNKNGQLSADGKTVISSTFDIYIDTEDPADQKNFYLWEWTQWEQLYICITCEAGTLDGTSATCIPANYRPAPNYDYVCRISCYDKIRNVDINVLSDRYVNGLPIVGRVVAKTPYYSEYGGLIEVRQYGVSASAYDYYKLLQDQTQTNGTLTDTPPAAIIGNIRNITDLSEKVAGYFGASGVSKARFWIDRGGIKDGRAVTILGREPNLEPSVPFRPPTMPCIESATRTGIKPAGWQ